jgi:hypothetical protein
VKVRLSPQDLDRLENERLDRENISQHVGAAADV